MFPVLLFFLPKRGVEANQRGHNTHVLAVSETCQNHSPPSLVTSPSLLLAGVLGITFPFSDPTKFHTFPPVLQLLLLLLLLLPPTAAAKNCPNSFQIALSLPALRSALCGPPG